MRQDWSPAAAGRRGDETAATTGAGAGASADVDAGAAGARPGGPSRAGRRQRWQVILGLLAGAAALGGLVLFGGGPAVLRAAAAVSGRALAWAAAFSLAGLALRGVKWHLYSRALGAPVTLAQSLPVYISGQSMIFTPARAGEFLKCVLLERVAGTPMAKSLPALLAERVTEGLALSILAATALAAAARGWAPAAAWPAVGVLLALNVLAAFVLGIPRVQAWAAAAIGRLRLASRWRAHLRRLSEGAGLSFQPRLLPATLALSIAAWALQCQAFRVIAADLGADPGALGAIGLFSLATIAGVASFMPAGLGAVEGSLTFLLVRAGWPTHEAAATALLARLFGVWLIAGLGALFLTAALSARPPRGG